MVKHPCSVVLLALLVLGCAASDPPNQQPRFTVTGQHATAAVSAVVPWHFSGPPRSAVSLIPRGLPSQPTASINFQFMPEGTDVSRLLLQQPWIGSQPRDESPVNIASASYTLFHREGELTQLWFAIVPLEGEVLVTSLTIAKGFEGYIPQFRADFERMLATLEIRRQPSNQAMQPTAGRRTLKFPVIPTSTPATTRALASGG